MLYYRETKSLALFFKNYFFVNVFFVIPVFITGQIKQCQTKKGEMLN